MEKRFLCPRRSESSFGASPMFARDNDWDPSDDTCRYCGSLAPDTFMARCEAGDIELGATDKSYKVYVRNVGGGAFKQTYRNCPRDKKMVGAAGNEYYVSSCDQGPEACAHWVTRDTDVAKFYFQHLGPEQRGRFVQMMNEPGKLRFEGGCGFYVTPFFAQRVAVTATDTVQ